MINLLNLTNSEETNEAESQALIKRHSLVPRLTQKKMALGINLNKARAEAEMVMYKPKPLEKIKLKSAELFGKKIKVAFFVDEEQLESLKNKFKIINQFEEERVSAVDSERFLGVLLDG